MKGQLQLPSALFIKNTLQPQSLQWLGIVAHTDIKFDLNIRTKVHGNPSNSYWDRSVWNKVVDWWLMLPSLQPQQPKSLSISEKGFNKWLLPQPFSFQSCIYERFWLFLLYHLASHREECLRTSKTHQSYNKPTETIKTYDEKDLIQILGIPMLPPVTSLMFHPHHFRHELWAFFALNWATPTKAPAGWCSISTVKLHFYRGVSD